MNINDTAPDFELSDAEGKKVKLSDFKGKQNVVLFFYPKDYSPGCTKEACSFRDSYDDFRRAGAEVIGISTDDAASHAGFAKKHGLQFILLTDPKGLVAKAYDIKKVLGLLPGRVTFIIDKAGIVRSIFSSNTDMDAHVKTSLEFLAKI